MKTHDDDCFLSGGDDGRFPCICRPAKPPHVLEVDRKAAEAMREHTAKTLQALADGSLKP